MKILLTSVGTRGDMEPLISIGEILLAQGHKILAVFPEQFGHLAMEAGLDFYSMGPEFIDMLNGEIGTAALGGGGSRIKRIIAIVKLGLANKAISPKLIDRQKKAFDSFCPDQVVFNPKSMYPYMWGVTNEGKGIVISPVPYLHYVKGNSHVAFNGNYGAFLNKFTFKLATLGLVKTVLSAANKLGIKSVTTKDLKLYLAAQKVIYTISPSLFPGSAFLPDHIKVCGYQERNKTASWTPSQELIQFLDNHKKILFVTFGSMTNPEPEVKTEIILAIIEKNGIPAIINTASGGLEKPKNYRNPNVIFVDRIPYDFILPKMYAVIHHGGSGTTHLALKYGCASMIIPHIIDQFVFNKILVKIGAGPKGIKIGKISISNLEGKVRDLFTNPVYKKNALDISKEMEKENFREVIASIILSK